MPETAPALPAYRPHDFGWGPVEARRYALAVGAPSDPLDRRDLRLVMGEEPQVLPTFAALLADSHSLRYVPLPGLDYDPLHVIYAGHELVLPGPLPSRIRGVTTSAVLEVGDVSSGVMVRRESVSRDAVGAEVARNVVTSIIRGRVSGTPAMRTAAPAEVEPVFEIEVPTSPRQAVVYSQTGDDNPLHWDPAAAAANGFERPILHGLCSYGMVVHALLRDLTERRWDALRRVAVRFTAPVVPGDVMRVRGARTGDLVRFSASVRAEDGVERLVLARGELELGAA